MRQAAFEYIEVNYNNKVLECRVLVAISAQKPLIPNNFLLLIFST